MPSSIMCQAIHHLLDSIDQIKRKKSRVSGWEQISRKIPKMSLCTICIPTLPTSTGTQPKRDEVGSICAELSIGLVGCIEVSCTNIKVLFY